MFSGRLILISSCCRRCGITTYVRALAMLSRRVVYHVAICSAFKEPFQSGLGKQQVAILSKYQAQAAWPEPWKSMNGVNPSRGFAFAWFKIGNENVGVYSVHLKSNLITHVDRESETAKNIQKREVAIGQLLAHIRDVVGTRIPTINGIVIGGDFNTNHDRVMFTAARTPEGAHA